jgi:hypothetical protein
VPGATAIFGRSLMRVMRIGLESSGIDASASSS